MRSGDISMLIAIHMYSKRKRIHTRNCVRVGLRFLKKIKTSDMFRPEYMQSQNAARVVLKLLTTMKIITLLLKGVDKMKLVREPYSNFWPHKSLMQQGRLLIIWHSVTRYQIYHMRSADISMRIIIQMNRKRKITYYELSSRFLKYWLLVL